MDDLATTDLRRALASAHQLAEVSDLREFPARSSEVLRKLIPCDHAGYNVIDLDSGRALVVADPPECVFAGGPETLARFGHQSPIIRNALSGDTHARRMSDFITRRELHRTDLYNHVYRLVSLEYQLAVQLPAPWRTPGRPKREIVGISLARSGRDFSVGERLLLEELGPQLGATLARLHELAFLRATVAATANGSDWLVLLDAERAVAWASDAATRALGLTPGRPLPLALARWVKDERLRPSGPGESAAVRAGRVVAEGRALRARLVLDAYPGQDALHLTPVDPTPGASSLRGLGLTRRQAEVLALSLEGRTNAQIADELTLSPRTVEKHFEAIYVQLGVANRAQAAAVAVAATR